MKSILIMGGTRFAGKALVEELASSGFKVTVISRNKTRCPAGVEQIIEEREQGLKKIDGADFDVCFDFIGYNYQAPIEVVENINIKLYNFKLMIYILNKIILYNKNEISFYCIL